MNTIDIEVEQHIDARPERIFDAWLDPAIARRFLFATDDGEMIRAEIDPRVGGAFDFTERREGGEFQHVGRYVVLDRPRTIVFDFSVPKFSKDETRVLVRIEPEGGGSRVRLRHSIPAAQAEWREKTANGWRMVLGNLARALAA